MEQLSSFKTKKIHVGTVTSEGENYNVVLKRTADNFFNVYARPYKPNFRPLLEGLPEEVGYVIRRSDDSWVAKNAGVLLKGGKLLEAVQVCIQDNKWLNSVSNKNEKVDV